MLYRFSFPATSLTVLSFFLLQPAVAQEHSIAREWNETLLSAIRRDFARPPVHARNLYHVNAAMYEAWAAYDPGAGSFLLGRTRAGYTCPFDGVAAPADLQAAREMAMSYAAYRLIAHRFQNSPGVFLTMLEANDLMAQHGYDIANTAQDYVGKGPAELGNYIAAQIIAYGMQDGSNEAVNFSNQYYQPVNTPLLVEQPGNPVMEDPNRWQQLTLSVTIDQQGNPIPSTPPFQSPEWGNVDPFCLQPSQMTTNFRDGDTYNVFLDPGPPALLDTTALLGLESFYKWNFCMVPIWQSHLDPNDTTLIDISPASKGNIQNYPITEQEIRDFYDYFDGGDPGTGHAINPVTGAPYAPQLVKRGDYTRILAEFWADGPTSETPPGHWFTILFSVMDHPQFERHWMGAPEVMDDLEYDVKAMLVLAGSLHDAAISAWAIKGWYDYVRPVSAVRYMAQKGQCSDPLLPNFHPAGLPLIPGHIEMVMAGDPLGGDNDEHVGKVKLYTWRGPGYITDPQTDIAGVGWILAENWFPYQRPTFVTPPFAGYISGHSTFSRTAAEVLTAITGSPFFPGGISNFVAPQNDFLVFEEGPSEQIVLQWATYRDASDQCSLSRIWGGIHPPVDDIPGRHLGMIIGPQAVQTGNDLFTLERPQVLTVSASDPILNIADIGSQFQVDIVFDQEMDPTVPPSVQFMIEDPTGTAAQLDSATWSNEATWSMYFNMPASDTTFRNIHLRIDSAITLDGRMQKVFLAARPFTIDTHKPSVISAGSMTGLINDAVAAQGTFEVLIAFDEPCAPIAPAITFLAAGDPSTTLLPDAASTWISSTVYKAVFQVNDAGVEIGDIAVEVSAVTDESGNDQLSFQSDPLFAIDTREPVVISTLLSDDVLNIADVGEQALIIELQFDEMMDMALAPMIGFANGDPLLNSLSIDAVNSQWTDAFHYQIVFTLNNAAEQFGDLGLLIGTASDVAGNEAVFQSDPPLLQLDTRSPQVIATTPSTNIVSDAMAGQTDLELVIVFDEPMDQSAAPLIVLQAAQDISGSLIADPLAGTWLDPQTWSAHFTVNDEGIEVAGIEAVITAATDAAGNPQSTSQTAGIIDLDTRNPQLVVLTANTYSITDDDIGQGMLQFIAVFDEPMDPSAIPAINFSENVGEVLAPSASGSAWLNNSTYRAMYDVNDVVAQWENIGVSIAAAVDGAGNTMAPAPEPATVSINIVHVGIEELASTTLHPHPNPVRAGEWIQLQLEGHTGANTLLWTDPSGRKVAENVLPVAGNGQVTIDVPALATGGYMLTITNDRKRSQARIVIGSH